MARFRRTFRPIPSERLKSFQLTRIFNGSYLIDLFDDGVQHLALERPEHNRLILYRIDDESLTGLNNSRTDHIDGGDGNNESVFSGARSFHLGVQFLFDRLHELRPKVLGMEQDFVFEGDLAPNRNMERGYVILFTNKK